ncbi:MAG: MFS transporter [Rickettsiaceae bacterium]|jgi:MFS family permease|nr:MFS transporter [Rickettsiaceae bacterium]
MTRSKKKVTGAFLGTIVEYYDYSLYGFSAGIIAEKFFPGVDKVSSLMYVFGIYALSYLAKPIGSVFFSKIGDKYGRRFSLKITMVGIAIPTLIIGILPEYNSIGVLTTQILVLCRFFQGFFVAGEYDGAAIYVIEHIGEKYHYTASSLTRSAGVAGLLLGIASTNLFNSSLFPEWAWRVPFILSLPLALITLYYRKFLEETPVFIESQAQKIEFFSLFPFIKRQWFVLCLVIILSGGFGVTYQVTVIFMKQYLPLVVPNASNIMSALSVMIVIGFGISMPIAGLLADRFGRNIVVKFSLLLTLIACVLLIMAINYQLLNLAIISCMLLAVSVAPFNALAHGVIIKAFRANERYRGVSIGHTTGSLLMSGTANYVCLYFMKNFNLNLFPVIYISFFAVVSYFAIGFFNKHQ